MSERDRYNPDDWQALCEFLDGLKGKCAYQHAIPSNLTYLIWTGGGSAGKEANDARVRLRLVFYEAGWGWRLRKGWRDRLERLRQGGVPSLEEALAEGKAEFLHSIEQDGRRARRRRDRTIASGGSPRNPHTPFAEADARLREQRPELAWESTAAERAEKGRTT